MTSFLWSQIAHNVMKARLRSVSSLNEPSMRELQNASSEDSTRRASPAARYASYTKRAREKQVKQSSSSLSHRGQLTTAPTIKRWRMTLIIKRRRMTLIIRQRRKSSKTKSRIFSGRCCFHTTRQCRTREAASGGACP